MQDADFHGLVDLAESGIHALLNGIAGRLTRFLPIAAARREAALHQGAKGRFVGAVAQTVALGNQDAFLGGLVIGHWIRATSEQTITLTQHVHPSIGKH